MRVVLAHAPSADANELRQTLLGAGLECNANDCVPWSELSRRLGQGDTDSLVFEITPDFTTDLVREARALTFAPMVGVGTPEMARVADEAGLAFVQRDRLREKLDQFVEQISSGPQLRGKLISVFAPTPGSGGTTVSANLAAAFAQGRSDGVALVELSRDFGDAGLLLNVQPEHTAEKLCARWQRLDSAILRDCAVQHKSGVKLLVNGNDRLLNGYLVQDAVRRLGVLARVTFPTTIFALDSRIGSEELEAMWLSDKIVCVIRPDVPSLRRAKWSLDYVAEQGVSRDRIQLVVNRWGQPGQLTRREIEQAMSMKPAAYVPDDPKRVNRAANEGLFLHEISPRCGVSKELRKLAKSLVG